MDYMSLKQHSLFIEAGQFDKGGWVLDTQFIPIMGSPYLLAHGLGKPVQDAQLAVHFPHTGCYTLWVFTKDWCAAWKQGVAPGLFEVEVNGKKSAVLGNEGKNWHWQKGGEFELASAEAVVKLIDKTGFEGRAAALFFTTDKDFVPPNDIKELTVFRRVLTGNEVYKDFGSYDMVVAGGGIAGMCAALESARRGLKTVLIQDRPVLGGNNSSEVRVLIQGETCFEPYPKIGLVVNELKQEQRFLSGAEHGSGRKVEEYTDEDDKRKLELLQREPNLTPMIGYALIDAKTENDTIQSVTVLDTKNGAVGELTSTLFVDATGDGVLGAAAGADFEVTTNGHMGMTNIWYISDTGKPQEFPRCPWAIDLSGVDFPGREIPSSKQTKHTHLGTWYWESGMEHDPIEKAEYARDTNFRAMYGAWDCIKNVDGDYKNYVIANACYIGGKRESRRFFGDVVLTKSDVFKKVKFPDACVPSTWDLDVHYPDRKFYPAFYEGDGFLTWDFHEPFQAPYFIPYRCLYSRNIKNLFLAGRCVSVSHDALGTVRVMGTGGMMGEVIGRAAQICMSHHCLPRDVYETYFEEFIQSLK